MREINEKLKFYAQGFTLGIIDINEVKEWIFEIIESHHLKDIPDDFFELVHCDSKQFLNHISEKGLTFNKTRLHARSILKYYLDKNKLDSSKALLMDIHLKNLFNIANFFELETLYTSLSLIHDDYYVNYVYPDKNTIDYFNFLDEIWLKIITI